ncbi:hypothetical protein B0O99DRAFT_616746 [Bisporella sp. PMI_857]|nr:hypothetical protein B0O99DRAFT_616746 [Bisporella sp. PMI_857]
MAQDYKPSKRSHPPLVDDLLQCGQLAFNPKLPDETRQPNKEKFESLIASTGTLALLPVLNLLVQPGRTEPWLRAPIISSLATLPLRRRGVQDTIEFVLSVHPSSAGYNVEANPRKGAAITHEGLNAASRLLSTPPAGMSPDRWFDGISHQLLSLLEGEGEPEMDRVAAFIIGFGILGRKAYGAPGMAGWKTFVEPIFRHIDPSLVLAEEILHTEKLTLGPRTLTSPSQLAGSLQRLTSLVAFHPHPSLTKRLLQPLLLPLWSLSSWQKTSELADAKFRKPALKLLKILLQLSSTSKQEMRNISQRNSQSNLDIIVGNLMFDGRLSPNSSQYSSWKYASSADGRIQIQLRSDQDQKKIPADMASIDNAATALVICIGSMPELGSDISQLFVKLCKGWFTSSHNSNTSTILLRPVREESSVDLERHLIEVRVLLKMMELIPAKLVDDSRQVLEIVRQVLSDFSHISKSNEDLASIALSLLAIVLESPNFRETEDTESTLANIKAALEEISKESELDISSTARNLLLVLRFRKDIDDAEGASINSAKMLAEDHKNYSLALQYLTSAESPPPVRVQGLELISGLLGANSPVVNIQAIVVLFSSLLQDGDEYIYLRIIKSFIELSREHPKAVMKDLVERYVDVNEDADLDQRLRYGEALLQVIQNSTASFSGEIARSACEGLLSIAGRRGYRPKTEKKQEKEARLKQKKDKDAEDAWGGEVPQVEDQMTPENEILAQIVSGWESKRGTEDIRIRASALSILGYGIESNVDGVGSTLISTSVDLSIHILTLEPEPEKGILRRSAILLIMSLVRALDVARDEGRKLGFGFAGQSLDDVQRILKYVEDTDNDGLVRQHSRDVIEGLQTWQLKSLITVQEDQTEIREIAGLSVRPLVAESSRIGGKPRIEEIE